MIARRVERASAPMVAGALTVAALWVAVLVQLLCAAQARHALGFPFAGVSPRLTTAVSIFANNARLLLAVFAAILVAQSPWLAGRGGTRGPLGTVLLAAVDSVLALETALNVALVGAAVGAYGRPMIIAVLPHGPVELAAYARALALYLRARRAPLARRRVAAVAATSAATLALAALLETFVAL
jgi:hypothetical protein